MAIAKHFKKIALDFLSPEIRKNPKLKSKIEKYMDREYSSLHCCVLSNRDKYVKELLEIYSIDIQNKEIIISGAYILAVDDYHQSLSNLYKEEGLKNLIPQTYDDFHYW